MHKLIPATPDLQLWHLLEACRVTNTKHVEGTRHILCSHALAYYLAREVLAIDGEEMPFDLIKQAFMGQPVKEVWAVINGTVKRKTDIIERDRYLRARARKRIQAKPGEVQAFGEAANT